MSAARSSAGFIASRRASSLSNKSAIGSLRLRSLTVPIGLSHPRLAVRGDALTHSSGHLTRDIVPKAPTGLKAIRPFPPSARRGGWQVAGGLWLRQRPLLNTLEAGPPHQNVRANGGAVSSQYRPAFRPAIPSALRLGAPLLQRLLAIDAVRDRAADLIAGAAHGPDAKAREEGRLHMWARA